MPETRVIQTAESPDVTTFTVKIEGEQVPGTIEVISFAISKVINRIPSAELVISDGSAASEDFEVSNDELFIPGKEIEILAGYHSDETSIFKGVVVKHSIKIRNSETRLKVVCKDKAFKTSTTRKKRYFTDSTDSDAIESILSEYGLEADVESTSVEHGDLVQFDTPDWAFILTRAEANGLFCFVDDGKFSVKAPVLEEPTLGLQFGATILELDAEIDGRIQYPSVITKSWDAPNQEQLEIEASDPGVEESGNLAASDLGSNLDLENYEMVHGGNLNQQELQAWADAKLLKTRLAKIRGRVLLQGHPELKPGMVISLAGVGDRFNGNVYVSGVNQNFIDGNWMTDVQFGLDPEWFSCKYELDHKPASGLLPSINGLHIGVVTQLESDPDGEDRILVKLPIIDPENDGVWSRLSCLDAGENRGTFFRPEIGDEVVVGFFNGDPRDPVVLGMLHSSAKPTPTAIADDNHEKGFISRSEMKMVFNDDKNVITFETPGGNLLELSEDAGGILIEDENGNKIEMTSDGITIESAKDINIKASGDINMEGTNVNGKANASFKAEGSASAEVSSSGTMTVKGSLVQIN